MMGVVLLGMWVVYGMKDEGCDGGLDIYRYGQMCQFGDVNPDGGFLLVAR